MPLPVLWPGSAAKRIQWLLRDEFYTALSAGSVHGTAAEPGPGTRAVTDTDSKLSIASGKMEQDSHSSPAWGDPGLWYGALTRAAGRVLVAKINLDQTTGRTMTGWDVGQAGIALSSNMFWFTTSANIQTYENSFGITVGIYSSSTEYHHAIVLRATGAYYFIKGGAFTNWNLLWAGSLISTATLYPTNMRGNSAGGHSLDFIRVPDALWLPQPELSDGFGTLPTVVDSGGNALTSTPAKVGFGGDNKAFFDGSGSFHNIYTSALNTAFSGAEGGVIARAKVANAGVWTDAANRYLFQIQVDASNLVYIGSPTTNNRVYYYYTAGGTAESGTKTSATETGFFTVGISWSKTGDAVDYYYDGSASGLAQSTGLGTWAGALSSTKCVIGAGNTTPAAQWHGWVGDCIVVFGQVPSANDHSNIHAKLAAGTLTSTTLDNRFGANNWAWWKLDEQYASDGKGHAETSGIGAGGSGLEWENYTNYISSGKLYNAPVAGAEEATGNLVVGTWYNITAREVNHFYVGCSVGDTFWATATTGLNANNKVTALTLAHVLALKELSTQDGIMDADLVVVAGTHVGIAMNWDDPDDPTNGVVGIHDGTNAILLKNVAGTWTSVISAAATYSANAKIRVIKSGTSYSLFYNGAAVGSTSTISDAGIISNKYGGTFNTYASNTIDDVLFRPRGTSDEYVELDKYIR